MATTEKNYQIIQKVAEDEFLLLHPETKAENVIVNVEGIEASNASGALAELNKNIKSITGGGVVTGVKGEAESEYRLGQVNITKANVGLGNVDNTADMDKPVSTAQKTAIDAKADKTYVDTELAKKAVKTDVEADLALKADKTYVDTELGKKQAAGDYATKTEVTTEIKEAIDAVVGEDVDTAFDTLKEIADWIKNDETSAAALTNRISQAESDISAIETKDTQQDTAIGEAKTAADNAASAAAGAQTTANKGVSDAAAAQSTADGAASAAAGAKTAADNAQADATENAGNITKIIDGTTKVGKASTADTATSATNATNATNATSADAAKKLATAVNIGLSGDATGSVAFDGSAAKNIPVTLSNSGVTAGSYSAVTVDVKGRVTAGAQLVEVGGEGQSTPSANLAVGGLFFKLM